MNRWLSLAFLCAAAALRADDLMDRAVASYRAGRLDDALRDMVRVVELDPANTAAKNTVWTIARKIQEQEKPLKLKPGELERLEREAHAALERRRERTKQVIARLKESKRAVSPEDFLSNLAGVERFLGPEFQSERMDAQARVYFNGLLEKLTSTPFVSRKDQLRAEGYLAYFQQKWDDARKRWEEALRLDPADTGLRADVEAVREVADKMRARVKIQDLLNQAETFQKTGYLAETARVWEEIIKLDPDYPSAREKGAVARIAAEKAAQSEQLKKMTDDGVRLFKEGKYVSAAEVFLEVLQKDPSHPQARVWLKAVKPRLEGNTSAAEGKPAVDSEHAEQLYRQGMVLYADEDLKGAVRLWTEALRYNPHLKKAAQALDHVQSEINFR
jgi:tetratricopeptide (TPR) repeat protein